MHMCICRKLQSDFEENILPSISSLHHQTLERKFVYLMRSSDPQVQVATAQFIYSATHCPRTN